MTLRLPLGDFLSKVLHSSSGRTMTRSHSLVRDGGYSAVHARTLNPVPAEASLVAFPMRSGSVRPDTLGVKSASSMVGSVARVWVLWCRDQVVASARNASRRNMTDSTPRWVFKVCR